MQTFSMKIGSVRRALKSRAEMIFIDAPHLVASTSTDDVTQMGVTSSVEESRGWFTWQVRIVAQPAFFNFNESGRGDQTF